MNKKLLWLALLVLAIPIFMCAQTAFVYLRYQKLDKKYKFVYIASVAGLVRGQFFNHKEHKNHKGAQKEGRTRIKLDQFFKLFCAPL